MQDALRADAAQLVRLIADGAQILVFGGQQMAASVRYTLAEVLGTVGQSPARLKAEGPYAEEVY